jgi:hypothetical protein
VIFLIVICEKAVVGIKLNVTTRSIISKGETNLISLELEKILDVSKITRLGDISQ